MQRNNHWKKLGKWAGAGVLGLTILLGHVYPLKAAEPVQVPFLSEWSISTLNEGEKYGIFPLAWYKDESFLQPIPADKFADLLKATEKKLDQLGLKKKAALYWSDNRVATREAVAVSLHKLLANYEWPAGKGADVTALAPLEYMRKHGLVKGTSAGLELDQPATVEQAAVMASRVVEFANDLAGGGAKGLLWKVTKGQNTLYLLGSIHMGTTDMYPMQKTIRDAYEASDDLWVEADILAGDMNYMLEKMIYSDGTTLKDQVSADTYSKLQKALASMKLPENAFDGYKPFAVGLSLVTVGYTGSPEEGELAMLTGIDRYFLAKAMLEQKPVHELEGIKLQADLLSGVPAEQQEKELNVILDSLLSGKEPAASYQVLQDMQAKWVQGDLEGMTRVLSVEGQFDAGGLNQRLVGERDKNMANKLAQLLEQEGEHTSFVVVGSAHYALKGMVLDQLKEKGYQVERLK